LFGIYEWGLGYAYINDLYYKKYLVEIIMGLFSSHTNLLFVYPIAIFIMAGIVSYFSIPVVITIAKSKNLVDVPDQDRKRHQKIIPTLGGIAIYASIVISLSLFSEVHAVKSLTFLSGALAILFFIGLKDDILVISPLKKLLGQLSAVFLVVISGLHISNLGGVFGVNNISLWVGVPLTFFAFIVIINAYNLIDGIDGLAGLIGVVASSAFGMFFLLNKEYALALLSFSLVGALTGFLIHNFSPATIFMGDTGSMIVGFLLAYQTIKFVELNVTHSVHSYLSHAAPILVVAILIVPLYDTLRVFIIRAIDGRSPFDAGFEHIHHQFLEMGLSHRGIALTLAALNVGFIALILLFPKANVNLLLAGLIATTLIVFPTKGMKRWIIFKLFHKKYEKVKLYKNIQQLEVDFQHDDQSIDKTQRKNKAHKEAYENVG